MRFTSKWITTPDFFNLPTINVFHKQYKKVEIPTSAFENYHIAFRGKFSAVDGHDYSIRISADDVYKLYINGRFVGQGVKQGIHESYSYNVFDITPFVTHGDNSIVIHAYYFGRINRAYQSADNRFGAVCDILENGAVIAGTDSSWKFSRLPEYAGTETCGYDTAFLEDLDFRKEMKGWREKDFDDSAWENALENANDDHIFRAKPATAVDVENVKPSLIKALSSHHYFIDFGHEIVGQFYMEMSGTEGQTVTIRCGEELNDDGSVRYDMRCNTKYEETCTLSGKRDVFLFYDYKAFRYVEVKTTGEGLMPETFSALFRHHPFREGLVLKTDNPLLHDIWKLCVHSVKCGSQECVVDCPHREKGQYLGDWFVTGFVHLYLTGDKDYYLGIVQDFADSCKICPGMMGVAPGSLMQEIADSSLQFPAILYRYYLHTGDKESIRPFISTAQEVVEHFQQYARDDGLLDGVADKWNLVDWPDNLRDGYDFPLVEPPLKKGCHNIINAHYIGALIHMRKLYELFGEKYDSAAEEIAIESFIRVFYDTDKKLFRDSETSSHFSLHANTLPAYYGFQPKEFDASITSFIEQKGLCCGIHFAYYVLKALFNMDADSLALRLILNDSEHGWVNMLREGATTIFEAWSKDQKWNTSLCHAWGSYLIIFLHDELNGKFGITVTKAQ